MTLSLTEPKMRTTSQLTQSTVLRRLACGLSAMSAWLILTFAFSLHSVAQLPDDLFQPYPEKADMLVVVAHPDDESTFGGLLPYYAMCQQKKVIFVCLTSGEWGNGLPHHSKATDEPDYSFDDADYPRFEKVPADALYPCYYRETELARMLLTVGVNYKPILPRNKDMSDLQPWGKPDAAFELWGGQEKVVGFLVSQIRRFQPDVVVTMAVDGWNRNPQHMAASRGTVLACAAAGDVAKFADKLEPQKPWTPKKLYLAVSDAERYPVVHAHDWELACDPHPANARIIAARGNAMHESQEMKEECPASTNFVLKQTAVGPDNVGKNNLFENIK